ncbi:succinate dehydrogenase, cytochrome b556 subunit [Aquicoccus sp. SCR17]|nr:succinate dehydrogenase, cytochrome b556 subunit [Carideicomes alvinocaridis]
MADVNRGNRPLSPFMLGQYYKLQLTSVTSILTRITGLSLLAGTVLVVWWFLAAATSPEAFAWADWALTSWLGDLVLFLSVWALWYHSLAGIRHLIWDTGRGLDLPTAYKLGWTVVIGSVVLAVLTAIIMLVWG